MIEFKEGENFNAYVGKFERLMRHLHPNLNGEFFVKEILLTMPERVRLFLAAKKLESEAELIETYTEWKEFKRGAYVERKDKKLHKELEETKKSWPNSRKPSRRRLMKNQRKKKS